MLYLAEDLDPFGRKDGLRSYFRAKPLRGLNLLMIRHVRLSRNDSVGMSEPSEV